MKNNPKCFNPNSFFPKSYRLDSKIFFTKKKKKKYKNKNLNKIKKNAHSTSTT